MLRALKRFYYGMAVLLALMGTSAIAQEKQEPCFSVAQPRGDSKSSFLAVGAILINRCTGDTWLLFPYKGGPQPAVKWFPLERERSRAGPSNGPPK